ncbi:Alpha-amylase [Hordeum vulgare]|nr:Alpha-amylase [Hordeum vulgare]
MRTRWPLPGDEVLIDNGKEWLLHLLSRCPDDIRDMITMICWRIWQLRSDQTHGKEVPPVHVMVDFLDSYYKSVMLADRFSTDEIIKGKMPSSAAPPMLEKTTPLAKPWPNPTLGRVALSVDGSFDGSDGSAAAGMVLRDNNGQLIFFAYWVIFHCNDALEAELHAIMQGMALAIQHSALPLVVQSDSGEALSSLLSKGSERSAYGHLVLEIKELMCNRELYP